MNRPLRSKITTLLFIGIFCLLAQQSSSQILTPRQLYPGLFEAVQLNNVFPDNKTFVDMSPKADPALIMERYAAEKGKPGFSLAEFVGRNFSPPEGSGINFKTDLKKGIRAHIDTLWQVLYRYHDTAAHSSLLPLKADFIIPGGRFREIYYWDSYFTMLGLQESKQTGMIDNMIRNFANLIDRYGFIPNGTRTYYLSRSQPPFFSLMVELLAKDKGESVLPLYRKELLAEYNFWMQGQDTLREGHAFRNLVRLADGSLLNRYWDSSDQPREESYRQDVESVVKTTERPGDYYRNIRAAAESGWDFSTRWFGESGSLADIQTTDLLAVDLNSLLYHLELTLSKSYAISGDKVSSLSFRKKATARRKAILRYCWDEKSGWFKDYNFKRSKIEKIVTLAGVFPLEFGIATKRQAARTAARIQSDFLQAGGLVTTLNRSGQQWDSPNGWAPLEYMAIDGLMNYGYAHLARTIAERWIALNKYVFGQTGKLVEKYNVIDTNLKAGGGEYSLQDGFGWTNGVLLNLMNHFEPVKAYPDTIN